MRARAVVLFAALAGALAFPALARAQPVRFSLDISPEVGGLDDTFTATVHIEVEGVAGPERYWHPDFGDFDVGSPLLKQGTSTVLDPVRGQQIRTVILRRYELHPRRGGRIRVRPARMRLGGTEYETDSVLVQVGPASGLAGAAPDPDDPGGQDPTAAGAVGVPGFSSPDPALQSQDMYLAGSFLMFLSLLTVVGMFISDLLLAALDPRIRLTGGVAK